MEHCGDEKEDTAIYMTGSRHNLEGLTIETRRMGISLDQANDVTIKNSDIRGRKQGNGIDLWKFMTFLGSPSGIFINILYFIGFLTVMLLFSMSMLEWRKRG